MDTATQVQILLKVVLHSANTVEKGMNPIIFPSAMGSSTLVWQLV